MVVSTVTITVKVKVPFLRLNMLNIGRTWLTNIHVKQPVPEKLANI